MSIIRTFLLLIAIATIVGCANNQTASFDPNKDLVGGDVFYVEKFGPDDRGLEVLIADNLSARGYATTTGPADNAPDDTTVVVTYADKWQWDITMYMIELTIAFRDPGSNAAFATGNSFHTSLTRQSPEKMIDEVLTNIFTADSDPDAVGGK